MPALVAPSRKFLSAIVVLFASACATADNASSWSGAADTLASGRIVVSNNDQPIWSEAERWTLRELFRVGVADGPPEQTFGTIRDIELSTDGTLYVLDSQSSTIRVFNPAGVHLRAFGREGEGPGELKRAAGLTLGPDRNLWVMNLGNARYSAFNPTTGEHLRDVPRPLTFFVFPWPGVFDAKGNLLDTGLSSSGKPAAVVLDSAFAPGDTIVLPQPDKRFQMRVLQGGRLTMLATDPFAPRPHWIARPAGGIIAGSGDRYRLNHISARGDTVMTVDLSRAPGAVTKEESDSALAAFRARLAGQDGATAEREPRIPAVRPAHGSIYADRAGRTWVVRTDRRASSGESWDVFDSGGRYLGTVAIPVSPTGELVVISHDRIAIATEVGDVETVVVFEIRGGQ